MPAGDTSHIVHTLYEPGRIELLHIIPATRSSASLLLDCLRSALPLGSTKLTATQPHSLLSLTVCTQPHSLHSASLFTLALHVASLTVFSTLITHPCPNAPCSAAPHVYTSPLQVSNTK